MLRDALWLGGVLFVGGTSAPAYKRKYKGGYDRHKPEQTIQKP